MHESNQDTRVCKTINVRHKNNLGSSYSINLTLVRCQLQSQLCYDSQVWLLNQLSLIKRTEKKCKDELLNSTWICPSSVTSTSLLLAWVSWYEFFFKLTHGLSSMSEELLPILRNQVRVTRSADSDCICMCFETTKCKTTTDFWSRIWPNRPECGVFCHGTWQEQDFLEWIYKRSAQLLQISIRKYFRNLYVCLVINVVVCPVQSCVVFS
jgi:hypothetical protein